MVRQKMWFKRFRNNILKHTYIRERDGTVRKPKNNLEYLKWFENVENRKIAFDTVGNVDISTIFLGKDAVLGMYKKPVLWETMIFGKNAYRGPVRYQSERDALKGHSIMVYRYGGIKAFIRRFITYHVNRVRKILNKLLERSERVYEIKIEG